MKGKINNMRNGHSINDLNVFNYSLVLLTSDCKGVMRYIDVDVYNYFRENGCILAAVMTDPKYLGSPNSILSRTL